MEQKHFPENLPPGWKALLQSEAEKDYFKKLTQFLKQEFSSGKIIFPARDRILRAIQSVDYDKVKFVILGQDPYHGPNQAMGLCFAVPNTLKPKPPSLMNIFKEMEDDLKVKIDFSQSELNNWTQQGGLLLNTLLTVRKGEAFSHQGKGWEIFTDKIISLLNDRKDPVIFILWGSPAKQKKKLITNPWHPIVESAHPSPLSAYRGFFGSKPFSKVNHLLEQRGIPPIDWAQTS